MSELPDSIPFEDLKAERLKIHHKFTISNFKCKNKELTDFLLDDALIKQEERVSSTFLVFYNEEFVGYFTLVNDCIDKREIQRKDGVKHYHYRSYPSLKIARLATKENYEGHDIGTHMVSMVYIAYERISAYSGCRIITVDSKTDSVGFYEKLGFKKAILHENKIKISKSLFCDLLKKIMSSLCDDIKDDTETVPMYIDYHKILDEEKRKAQQQLIL